MSDTKNKIIEATKILFFEQGIANVRLQQIADTSGISVGNLAYHFKNKEAIVETVYENLFTELSTILSQYMIYSQLSGFDKQFAAMYNFYCKNKFTFNNSWEIERNYEKIQHDWLILNNKILMQLLKRIDYNLQNGFFKTEPYKGAYENLAESILLTINSWIPQQMLRNKLIKEEWYKKNLWGLLYPILTNKGILEFNQTIAPVIF